MRILTQDILSHLCDHMDLLCLARMCSVNRLCKGFLMRSKPGKAHWARIGKLICGEENWNDRLFDEMLDDDRYKAKLHICPWTSQYREMINSGLSSYCHLGSDYRIHGMRVLTDFECSMDAELEFRVSVKGSRHVVPGLRTICMSARDADAPTAFVREELFELTTTDAQRALRAELDQDPRFQTAYRRYGMQKIASVHPIHRSMFAVVFVNSRVWDHMSVVFFSTRNRLDALWEIRIHCGEAKGVAFRPGEMWFATMFETVYYYGPRGDRQAIRSRLEGLSTRAFWAVITGNTAKALDVLGERPLNFTHGGLTIFDYAADPTGDGTWKHRADLTADAAMLLAKEPRFEQTVFMLKRAIHRRDPEGIRKTGLRRILHADVLDSVEAPEFIPETLSMLEAAGVRVVGLLNEPAASETE